MNKYVITVEQIHTEGGKLGEYATKSDPMTDQAAKSFFYDKCAAINKDLSENGHAYACVKIINSKGGVEKTDELGTYIEQ